MKIVIANTFENILPLFKASFYIYIQFSPLNNAGREQRGLLITGVGTALAITALGAVPYL